MENLVMVSDIVWIPRGVPKKQPDTVEVSNDQIKELIAGGTLETTDNDSANEDEEVEERKGLRGSEKDEEPEGDDDMKEYLKEYDDEEKAEAKGPSMQGIAMFASPEEDPYMTKHTDSDEEEEKDDFVVRSDDNYVVVSKVDKGNYSLEVRIFNEANGDWYVHHDYLLEAPALCIEPFQYDPGSEDKKGNLLAAGTITGSIEVWDLDIVNSCEPAIIFGKKTKGKKKRDGSHQGHNDAVLSIRWNTRTPHILASGDVEGQLILWDIDEVKAATVITSDHGGLQSMQWHPVEDSILLSGSMGGQVAARDCRSSSTAAAWMSEGQVEKVLWDHFNPFYAFASSNDGMVRYMDMRVPSSFVWEHRCHDGAVEGLSLSRGTNGLLVTAANDASLGVWKVSAPSPPSLLTRQSMSLGPLHSALFSPNSPSIVVVGGESEDLTRVVDVFSFEKVREAFI